MYIKFEDNKGGSVTIQCKNKEYFGKLQSRYLNKGWKQVEYKLEKLVEFYPF